MKTHGGALGGVDQLLSKALRDALDVTEAGLASTDGEESDGLVDTAKRGDIDGLAADGTGGANTGGVLTGTAVDNGVNGDLDGVLVGHDVDDLEGVGDNAGSQELLSVVATVHHDGVGQTLDDGALSLAETLGGIAASGVGDVDRGADLDVVAVKIESASLVVVYWPVKLREKSICGCLLSLPLLNRCI